MSDDSTTFYSSTAWKKMRSQVKAAWRRAARPCAICRRPLNWLEPMAVVVDHIKPRRAFPHLALEPANLHCLCRPCHERIKKLHDVTRPGAPVIGADGYPTGSEWS